MPVWGDPVNCKSKKFDLRLQYTMPSIEEIREIEHLKSSSLRWSALLAQTRGGSFFHSLDWLLAYWRHFGHGQELRVLVASSHGEIIGILPLVLRREATRLGAIRVLTYPLQDWGSFYGPIGGQPAATLLTAMLYLRRVQRDWDVLDLRWIDETVDGGRTQRAMEMAGFSARAGVWATTCIVDLPDTWNAYFSGLSSKFRNNLRRAEKRLAQEGDAILERYRPLGAAYGDGDPRWALYDECVEISRRSWQGRSATGTTLCHSQVADFFRDTHFLAAQNGTLDITVLRLNGQAVAFSYNYHTDGALYGLRMGYDPAWAHCGVGSVLLAWTLRDSIRRGDHCLDMGVATHEIKQCWNPRMTPLGRVTHYPAASPRAQLLAWKRRFHRRVLG